MFDWKNFPWTDFQDLNLDWILRKIKELKTVDLPALDDKIDNVYEYIKEQLPEIVTSLAEVIIDVTQHGVVGDGSTDNSAALENCLNMGNIFYFPVGTYKFKNVDVNKPVYIFGDGDDTIFSPIRYSDLSNLYNNMFIFHDSVYMSDIQLKPDAPIQSESGTNYYVKSILDFEYVDHVHLERMTIDRVWNAYHIGWANPVYIPFENRQGMAITSHGCGDVCINDIHVIDFGGEELIWICQDRDSWGNGFTKITNCVFEKTSYAMGSLAGIFGGKIVFTDNVFNNFNAAYNNPPTNSGTIINLCGAYTICNDNAFYNCQGGNYIDFSEGYFCKSEYVKCSGNIFTGKMHAPINVFASSLDFSDNYIEGPEILRIRGTTIPYTYHAGDGDHILTPYCEDVTTVFTDFKDYSIHDNKCIVTAPLYTLSPVSYDAPFSMQNYSGGDFIVDEYNFYGNTVVYNDDAVVYNVIYFTERVKNARVSDNNFKSAGLTYPSVNVFSIRARGIISGDMGCDKLIVNNNIIDCTNDLTRCAIITVGTETFKGGTNVVTVFNRGEGTFTYNEQDYPQVRDTRVVSSGTSYASRYYEYNSNITQVTT